MDFSLELAGLKLSNPFMNASGIMGNTGLLLKRLAEAGMGAVVTKSISLEPKEGYPNPVLVELPFGYLNAIGLANPGAEAFVEELKVAKEAKVPVIVSVFGSSIEEFARVAFKMEEAGADAIELNLSCPHAGGLLTYSQDPRLAYETMARVKHSVSIPVFAKLSAETNNLVEVGKAVERAGADGVTAINTVRAMSIDVDLKRPALTSIYGGLSGPAIKPIAVRCVYQLYEALSIPVIGVGGILDHRDVIEFLLAGAHAVQLGSCLALKGLEVVSSIIEGLRRYLELQGLTSLRDLVGLAHGDHHA